jgi:hypothetical protein
MPSPNLRVPVLCYYGMHSTVLVLFSARPLTKSPKPSKHAATPRQIYACTGKYSNITPVSDAFLVPWLSTNIADLPQPRLTIGRYAFANTAFFLRTALYSTRHKLTPDCGILHTLAPPCSARGCWSCPICYLPTPPHAPYPQRLGWR